MIVAVDTEWAKGNPYCLSFSSQPGTATVIMADQLKALSNFNKQLQEPDTLTVLHNSIYDLPVLAPNLLPTGIVV